MLLVLLIPHHREPQLEERTAAPKQPLLRVNKAVRAVCCAVVVRASPSSQRCAA